MKLILTFIFMTCFSLTYLKLIPVFRVTTKIILKFDF